MFIALQMLFLKKKKIETLSFPYTTDILRFGRFDDNVVVGLLIMLLELPNSIGRDRLHKWRLARGNRVIPYVFFLQFHLFCYPRKMKTFYKKKRRGERQWLYLKSSRKYRPE
jgi:hypothetical protein